jgi:NAD-dependent deacetylase
LADLERQFQEAGRVEPCHQCGGIIKTATISFGQSMPEREMARAQVAIESCDLCVVAGSSLVVYPAASFPEYAKRRGAALAIVNREETPLDSIADLVVHAELGPTLAFAAELNSAP